MNLIDCVEPFLKFSPPFGEIIFIYQLLSETDEVDDEESKRPEELEELGLLDFEVDMLGSK